jgi:hypothetical protein
LRDAIQRAAAIRIAYNPTGNLIAFESGGPRSLKFVEKNEGLQPQPCKLESADGILSSARGRILLAAVICLAIGIHIMVVVMVVMVRATMR